MATAGCLYQLHLRIGKVNLHAFGCLPASQMKEHFEPLPGLEEEWGLSGLLNVGSLYLARLAFPRIPQSGKNPAA
ncbi:uncharacterized [Tachysurus ichikawai]